MSSLDSPFGVMRYWRQRIGEVICTVYAIDFSAERFQPADFPTASIEMPPQIARSVRRRQAEFFYGRLVARQALAGFGLSAATVGIGARREPLFPAEVHGSITHCSAVAAAVVVHGGACKGVGIDIEAPLGPEACESVRLLALCEQERALLRKCCGLPEHLAVALVFSAKESFYKALSSTVGHIFDFSALCLENIVLPTCSLHFRTTEELCREWPAGTPCKIDFSILDTGEVFTAFAW